jgi:hypothetical protein
MAITLHRIYLVNAGGTHPLGDSAYAQSIWDPAASPPQKRASQPVWQQVNSLITSDAAYKPLSPVP